MAHYFKTLLKWAFIIYMACWLIGQFFYPPFMQPIAVVSWIVGYTVYSFIKAILILFKRAKGLLLGD